MEENNPVEKPTKKVPSSNPFDEPAGKNPFEEEEDTQEQATPQAPVETPVEISTASPFTGLISRCFENHLNIFVDSQDKYVTGKNTNGLCLIKRINVFLYFVGTWPS